MGLLLGSCEGLLTWTLFLLLSAQSQGDCPAPEMPPHATLGGAELNATYPVGSTLRFSCIPGYTVIVGAKRFIECLENSTWSTTPTFCEIKKCRVPVLENGKVESSGDFQFGDTVNFACNYGYRLLGSTSARCTLYEGNNVDWNKTPPHCEQIPCERPPSIANGIHNGDESSDHYTVGTVVTYTCNNDFSLIGNLSIDCVVAADGVNGIWSGPAPECRGTTQNLGATVSTVEPGKRCPVPVIENGDIQTTGDLRLGETATFVCNKGYRMLGPNTARCTLFEGNKVDWNRQPPYCERIPCARPPRIANGRHDGDEGLDHYDYGTKITYTCEKDFTLIGTASISCTSDDGQNGHWDRPAPECKVVVCQRPEITNGMLTTTPFQSKYKYDHVLRFVCNAGHILVGSEFVKCGADNSWHPALPICIKEKSLEDRLDSIEKKVDLILLKVIQSFYQQTRGKDEQ